MAKRGILVLLLPIAALIGLGGCVLFNLAETDHDPGKLLHDSRHMLSVCVAESGASGSIDEGAAEVPSGRVETILTELTSEPDFPQEYRDWQVVSGCPRPNARFGTPIYKLDIERPVVDVPSEHRLVVYFVSDSDYASTFPEEAYVNIAQERMCEGDVCRSATEALYVPLSITGETLELAIKDALRLLPYTPDIDPTVDPTRCLATSPKDGRCDALRY